MVNMEKEACPEKKDFLSRQRQLKRVERKIRFDATRC